MTQIIRSRSASSVLTESSTCPEVVRRISTSDASTTSSPSTVLRFEAAVIHPRQREGWRDIHTRAAELEQNPGRARALVRARQRLAETLFTETTLSALRLRKGMSQAELARRIGSSQSRLSRIEAGLDDPRRSTLLKLSEALGETLDVVSRAIGAGQGEQNG
ncbi:helix-turn-helix transcriptional regulator [Thauera linaloolentis]|uniref:HTH cro/C1-type domain-containing protein n=1 Tax=Thauera linaloolentis (strain DSM 12138 / JCM 21573 / CCUG 41526 / CIP 105981 / IAM 15112 / NBRC 102519 / 47Lol) TaxID=1123367 RepID=N6YG21_THAL4|nr:hypothetical protein C666_00985 [Thauera linaloolentis 47Lol = DSM 12138]